jgi:hypothetical protein
MSHTPKPFDKNKYGWPEKPPRDGLRMATMPVNGRTYSRVLGSDGEGKNAGYKDGKLGEAAKDKVKNTSLSEGAEAAKDKVKNASPSEAAEAANKYKGIIQLGVLAVGIAGTVGAYVWGKN